MRSGTLDSSKSGEELVASPDQVWIENLYLLEAREVARVEGQDLLDRVDVHRRDNASVMRVLSRNTIGTDQPLPFGKDSVAFRQNLKKFLKSRQFPLREFGGHSKAVFSGRTSGDHPELDEILNRDCQGFAGAGENGDCIFRDRSEGMVGLHGPDKNICVD